MSPPFGMFFIWSFFLVVIYPSNLAWLQGLAFSDATLLFVMFFTQKLMIWIDQCCQSRRIVVCSNSATIQPQFDNTFCYGATLTVIWQHWDTPQVFWVMASVFLLALPIWRTLHYFSLHFSLTLCLSNFKPLIRWFFFCPNSLKDFMYFDNDNCN
jgi:hypothetical protein